MTQRFCPKGHDKSLRHGAYSVLVGKWVICRCAVCARAAAIRYRERKAAMKSKRRPRRYPVKVSILLTEALDEQLRELAAGRCTTVCAYVRQLIRREYNGKTAEDRNNDNIY